MWQYNYSSSELYHHGIKGQRWGVRRFRKSNGSLTNAGKKRYSEKNKDDEASSKKRLTTGQKVAIGAAVAGTTLAVIGGLYLYKKANVPTHVATFSFGTKIDLNSLSNVSTTLPSGTKMHRVSSKSVEDYSEQGKRIYASYLKKDARLYKEVMPDFIRDWGKRGVISGDGASAYAHVMKTSKPIKIASKREVAEAYMKATKARDLDAGAYRRFTANLVNRNNPEVNGFFKALRDKGFGAIIDENDAGTYAKSPIILLNPSEDIASSKSHKISVVERFINVLLM